MSSIAGHGYKTRLLNPLDEFWDRRLGVRTFGYRPGSGQEGMPNWQLHYTPTPYVDIFRSLQSAALTSDDSFTDLGAGMGRAVFAAGWLGVKRATGVEILPDLHELAIQNAQCCRLVNCDIRFVCDNALNVTLADTSVLYIFHSFGDDVLRAVLRNLENRRETSRRLRIIYMNPVFNSVLKEFHWLEQIDEVAPSRNWLSTANHYNSAIWQSV